MSGSMNKVILIGALGKDPEIRATQTGDRIASLSVATSETWRDKQTKERKERVEWHKVVIFDDKLVEVAEKYLRKGAHVALEGSLQTRKFTGGDGVDRYFTEVVLQRYRGELIMLDRKSDGGKTQGVPRPPGAKPEIHDDIAGYH